MIGATPMPPGINPINAAHFREFVLTGE